MSALGDNLSKFLRIYRVLNGGESQQKLADLLGFSRATINRWESKGAGSATLDEVEAISAKLQHPAEELLGLPILSESQRRIAIRLKALEQDMARRELSPVQKEIIDIIPLLDEPQARGILDQLRAYIDKRLASESAKATKKPG